MSRCVFLPISTCKILHSFSSLKVHWHPLLPTIRDSTQLVFCRPRNKRSGPTCLVLSPTRELAQQIEMEVKKFSYRGIRRFLLLFLLWIWLIILSLIFLEYFKSLHNLNHNLKITSESFFNSKCEQINISWK